jgi:hypothetical protein
MLGVNNFGLLQEILLIYFTVLLNCVPNLGILITKLAPIMSARPYKPNNPK